MDCREIVRDAMKRQGFTTPYQLAKALGYANPSSIYAVAEGKRGLSGDRLMQLLKLAGKLAITAIGFSIAIGVAPIENAYAESNSQLRIKLTKNTHYTHIRSAQPATSKAA